MGEVRAWPPSCSCPCRRAPLPPPPPPLLRDAALDLTLFERACLLQSLRSGWKRAGGGVRVVRHRARGRRRARVDGRGRRASRLPHLSDVLHAVVELLSSVLVGDVLAGVIPTLLPPAIAYPADPWLRRGSGVRAARRGKSGKATALLWVVDPRFGRGHRRLVTARWRQKRAEVQLSETVGTCCRVGNPLFAHACHRHERERRRSGA